MKEESLEKSASIRKLLAEGLQCWKERRALKSLEEGKMRLLKREEALAGLNKMIRMGWRCSTELYAGIFRFCQN